MSLLGKHIARNLPIRAAKHIILLLYPLSSPKLLFNALNGKTPILDNFPRLQSNIKFMNDSLVEFIHLVLYECLHDVILDVVMLIKIIII
jgi:hypothetical protein